MFATPDLKTQRFRAPVQPLSGTSVADYWVDSDARRSFARRNPRRSQAMSTTLTVSDQRLKDSVTHQLEGDPALDASMVGVSARDGVVALTGYVDTYAAKLAAERSARRVYGVTAVVNELEVKLATERIDPDIAKDALEALKNRIDVPPGVAVTVRGGFITLGGAVEWMYQKMAAERAVKYLRGVRGIFNQIALTPKVSPKNVQKLITEALHRQADIDAHRIHVVAEGAKVILSGTVSSWAENDEAQRAAWAAPGVISVENRIAVVL
jgi:osmotically-inducible protein OsmY